MGHSHAVSGMAVAAAALPVAPVHHLAGQIAWVAAWGGAAMIPDLDQRGATVGRMWGPPTELLARGIGAVARGHRNGTHDVILGPLAFGAAAMACQVHPWALLALLAFTIGVALKACAFAIPGRTENTVIGNLVLSWGGAWALTHFGAGVPSWLPAALAGGCLVHIVGDALTVGGCPVPFTWLDGHAKRYSLHLFRTGTSVERFVLAPAFIAATVVLLYLHTHLSGLLRLDTVVDLTRPVVDALKDG